MKKLFLIKIQIKRVPFDFYGLARDLDLNNIYCQNIKYSLMIEKEQFDSQSDSSLIELPQQPIAINILKHLPAPLQLLDHHNPTYEIYSPRCLYTEELSRTNKYLMPRAQESGKATGHRLLSIEDAVFEHSKIKEKIKELSSKNQKEISKSLWEVYRDKQMYYSRFEPTPKKQNFASVFMNVAGINLESKARGSFPQIKPKTNAQIIKNNNGPFIFDSHFESGNLLFVFNNNDEQNAIDTYDLILQNDINTRGHNQWFFFKITNTKKNQKIKLNIVNLVKKESLFSYGLKPLVFSQKNQKNGLTWHRGGFKVCYEGNNIKREHKAEPYYTLSFEYEFREAFDTVYFAPSYPYTYTQLLYHMDGLLANREYQNFLSIKLLCETVGKNAVNLISISTGKQAIKDSKIVWILARQHPVETTSSFMVEGIINYLLQLMTAASRTGDSFLNNYIFKIVPMVNPDGVIHGNTRAELTGIDPNRAWKKTHKSITPSTHFIKKQILKARDETCLILDLHSHSKKLGCFFYGNYDSANVRNYRMLPSKICQNDVRFSYRNCRFRGGNDNSARKTFYSELNIPNIFTVECSLLGYVKDNRITEYKIQDYHQMGVKIIQTFFQIQREKCKQEIPTSTPYPDEKADFCDAQSARSDSCVSDDEFAEVYSFAKGKKKIKDCKKKPKSNTFIQNQKLQTSDHQNVRKPQYSSAKINEHRRNDTQVNNQQNLTLEKVTVPRGKSPYGEFKEEGRMKMKSKYNSKNIRLLPKKIYQSFKEDVNITQNPHEKSFNQQSIQVEQLKNNNSNEAKTVGKNEKRLMVVGNGVEEDKIFIGKNEVGIQMDCKQNLNNPLENVNKPASSSKIYTKLTRRVEDLGEGHLDRSMKMEKKGLLMFRN